MNEDYNVDIRENQIFSSGSESKNEISFHNKLGDWANKFDIKQNAFDSLLVLLKGNGHPDLPNCARMEFGMKYILQASKSADAFSMYVRL